MKHLVIDLESHQHLLGDTDVTLTKVSIPLTTPALEEAARLLIAVADTADSTPGDGTVMFEQHPTLTLPVLHLFGRTISAKATIPLKEILRIE
jgi:hypothetical protein